MEEFQQPERQTADQAITSKEQDKLRRSSFADHLAGFIADWSGDYSLVIALHGPWGSGKSSVKNMVLESLETRRGAGHPEQANPILEFNPWHWAGQDQLTTAFFSEIGKAIGKAQPTPEARERVSSRWKEYGAILTVGSSISDSIGTVLPYLGVPTFGIPAALSKVLSRAAGLSEAAVKGAEAEAKRESKTLEEIKKEVSDDLAKLKTPVLIIMDDIDRLTPDELKLLFGLVKANADFPKLVFLLLFQRETVAESLAKALNIPSGDQYLKKIIQLEFNIPQVDRTQLDEILHAGIRNAFPPTECKFLDNYRWLRLYGLGLQDYFQTLRDVYRFITTLAFHVGLLSKNRVLEVNPMDLVVLQGLRIFEPSVYDIIANSKWALTVTDQDLETLADVDEDNAEEIKAAEKRLEDRLYEIRTMPRAAGTPPLAEDTLPPAEKARRERLGFILKTLFPVAFGVPEEKRYGFPHDTEQERLACHPKAFDYYFYLGVPRGEVSRAEIRDLVAVAAHQETFLEKLRRHHKDAMLIPTLRGLAARLDEIPLESAVPFLTALCDLSDEVRDVREEGSNTRALILLTNIATSFLNNKAKSPHPFKVLHDVFQRTSGLTLPSTLVQYEENAEEVDEAQARSLKGLVAAGITARVHGCELSPATVVNNHLRRWLKWGKLANPENETEAEKWIRDQLADDKRLRTFLRVFKNRQDEYFDGQDLSLLPLLSAIVAHVGELNLTDLSPEEQEGVATLKHEYRNLRELEEHMEQPAPDWDEIPHDE